MFNNEYSPYDELQMLKQESINQRQTLNSMIQTQNKMQDLLVEFGLAHQKIVEQYRVHTDRLQQIERNLNQIERILANVVHDTKDS